MTAEEVGKGGKYADAAEIDESRRNAAGKPEEALVTRFILLGINHH